MAGIRPQVIDDQGRERVDERSRSTCEGPVDGVHLAAAPVPARHPRGTAWAVRARTDGIQALGPQLRNSGIKPAALAYFGYKYEPDEPTEGTAEETEAGLPTTETGSGRIRTFS